MKARSVLINIPNEIVIKIISRISPIINIKGEGNPRKYKKILRKVMENEG